MDWEKLDHQLDCKIGQGSFGTVYKSWDENVGKHVALKIDNKGKNASLAQYESKLIQYFQWNIGFPQLYSLKEEENHNVIVMELLGSSLYKLFKDVGCFSVKTVTMIADQVLTRLMWIHNKKFIHRDIKPDNILTGIGKDRKLLYLIDFGLWKRYWDTRLNRHEPSRHDRDFVGTARYASLNSHLGIDLGRRDDLESLCYVACYLLRGKLPWQNASGIAREDRYRIIGEIKAQTNAEDLFEGYPVEWNLILKYIRSLTYEQTPDYGYIRQQLHRIAATQNFPLDNYFDWAKKERPTTVYLLSVPPANQARNGQRRRTMNPMTAISGSLQANLNSSGLNASFDELTDELEDFPNVSPLLKRFINKTQSPKQIDQAWPRPFPPENSREVAEEIDTPKDTCNIF